MKGAGLVALSVLILVACAHVPVQVADGLTFAERQARLRSVAQWSMRGRLAVAAGAEGFSGRFSWVQRDGVVDLRVRGPLGAGAMAIQGDPEHLTVTARGSSEPVRISDPERELPHLLGWWVPVRSVPAWLLGIPDDAYPAAPVFDGDGLVTNFQQRDWLVAVQRYQLLENTLIPARLELIHQDLSLKVIVDSWVIDHAD